MTRKTSAFMILALAVILIAVIAGCGNSAAPDGTSSTAPAATTASTADGGGGPTTTAGSAATSTSLGPAAADGKQIFADFCSSCHGLNGQGGVGPDLRAETDINKVQNQVRTGGRTMPSLAGRLSDAQITAVAQYVLSLAGQ